MGQPSQINNGTYVVAARVSAANFQSLNEELADRGLKRQDVVAGLILTWLNAVTGRGHRCDCADCPGNIRTLRRRVDERLFEDMTA